MRSRRCATLLVTVCLVTVCLVTVAAATSVSAATVTASRVAGHRDVTINGYGTSGLGMFLLDTGSTVERAWCIEADVAHSRRPDAYREIPSTIVSAELDVLVWSLARTPQLDDDTATAAAALIWYYAEARRSIGPPVWSDGSRAFAPISPTEPVPWDSLRPYGLSHPVGLRAAGVDLDAAERRVVELHRRAVATRGPWEVSADPRPGTFVVRGPGGPIAGAEVAVTLQVPGEGSRTTVAKTGDDGAASIALPSLPRGGTISARVESPGRHRSWDGGPNVQRLVTATTRVITSHAAVPPPPRHLAVHKSSSDQTLSPAGAEFELRDANDDLVDRGRTGSDGRLAFGPIDAVRHPPPYRVVETDPPLGLEAAGPVTVADASTDPRSPTIVPVVNTPALVDLIVRKRLSRPGHGPPDRSGFEFDVVRRSDGLVRRGVTGADGRTPPMPLPFGEYDVCERERPGWADVLTDPGCRSVIIGDGLGRQAVVQLDYVNEVPIPTITTSVADVVDGDRAIPDTGATVVDRVTMHGLVPETAYRWLTELVAVDGTPVGVDADVAFTVSEPSVEFEVLLAVPPLPTGRYVIVGRLVLDDDVATEVVVHHDLTDAEQTMEVVTPHVPTTGPATTVIATMPDETTTSTSSSTTSTSTTSTSTVPASGPTLPRTGSDQATRTLLRAADLAFVTGVGAIAAAGLLPRRRSRLRAPERP